MAWLLLLVLQLAAPAAGTVADFDLRNVKPPADCSRTGDEIVVCGRRDHVDRNRLMPLPANPYDQALVAETGIIGNVRGGVTVENFALPGGIVSNRAMANIKIPF